MSKNSSLEIITKMIFNHYFPGTTGYDVIAALLNTHPRESYGNVLSAANSYFVKIVDDHITEKTFSDTLAMVRIAINSEAIITINILAISDKSLDKINSQEVFTTVEKNTSFGDNITGMLLTKLSVKLGGKIKDETRPITLNAFFNMHPEHKLKISVLVIDTEPTTFTQIVKRSR